MDGSPGPVLLVALLVVLAGCSAVIQSGSVGEGETPTTDARTPNATWGPTAASTSTETATPTETAAPTETATPTPTSERSVPEEPRIVALNYEPEYDLALVLERTEDLRALDARERIYVEEVEPDIRRRDGTELAVGDTFDPPDRAGYFGERAAKALQFYSAANVTYLGYPRAGVAGETLILVGNESHFESVTGRAPVTTVVHEIVHSLQQQHNLSRRDHPTYTTDERFAVNAVFEGDATLTAQQYWEQFRPGGVAPYESRNETPSRDRWRLSLSDRVRLYGALYLNRTSAPAERDAALREPPNTTAEVLHPSLERALPNGTVPRPDVRWPVAYHDRVGELTTRHALRVNGVSAGRAARASTGWRNDVLSVYRTGDAATVYWGTRWANASEAGEFAGAWYRMLLKRNASMNGALWTVPGTENTTRTHYAIKRDGPLVYVAASENASHARHFLERFPSRDA